MAVILGFKSRKEGEKKKGTTGIILGIISLFLVLVLLIFFLVNGFSPIFIFESCSMYHSSNFDNWWVEHSSWYENKGILKTQFKEFPMKEGITRGDLVFIFRPQDYKLGDIIIFNPNSESSSRSPILHRIISISPIGTTGDNNKEQLILENNAGRIDETNIPQENIIGKVIFKIPYVGWTKIILSPNNGFCS